MTTFGYTLSSEEHSPLDLVDNARRAEELGFSFVSISDHYHPWLSNQGHSPFVWSVLGGIAASTESVEVGVGVTCPIMRIHPAVLAQATATTALMLPGRFVWGVGTGEALNEHILGDKWPTPAVRLEMLEESIELIRKLWTGDTVEHRGKYFTVENARLFDVPANDPPIVVSAFGPKAAELAGRVGDGLWGSAPQKQVVDKFEGAGGSGPRYAQLTLCWAEDTDSARKTALEHWANTAIPGQLSQDLPTWQHFEEASQVVTEKMIGDKVPCGPDPGPIVKMVKEYVDAGYTHLYFHQIGPDQDGFFKFWKETLEPALG